MRWQSVWVCAGFAMSSAVFAITEGLAEFSAGAVVAVAACRFASIAMALLSWAGIRSAKWAGPRLEVLIVVSWAMQLVCEAAAAGVASTLAPPGLASPFSPFQWWPSACSMTHAVLVVTSGLRFPLVAALAVVQALLTGGGFASPWTTPDLAVAVSFELLVFGCACSAYAHEATTRAGFFGEGLICGEFRACLSCKVPPSAALVRSSEDGALHERLVEGLLPWHVRARERHDVHFGREVGLINAACAPLPAAVVLPSRPQPNAAAAIIAALPARLASPRTSVIASSLEAVPDTPVVRWRLSRAEQALALDSESESKVGSAIPRGDAAPLHPSLLPPALDTARSTASAGGGMRRISITTRSPPCQASISSEYAARLSGPPGGRLRAESEGEGCGVSSDPTLSAGFEWRGRRRVSVVRVGGSPNRALSEGEDNADAPESISAAVARSVSSVMSSARSDDSTGGGAGDALGAHTSRSYAPPPVSLHLAARRLSGTLSGKPAQNSSADGRSARIRLSATAVQQPHGFHRDGRENWDARRIPMMPTSVPVANCLAIDSAGQDARRDDGVADTLRDRSWSASPAASLSERQRPSSGRGAVEHLGSAALLDSPHEHLPLAGGLLRRASTSAPVRTDLSSNSDPPGSGDTRRFNSQPKRPESAGAIAAEAKPPSHPSRMLASRPPPARSRLSSHGRPPAFDLSTASSKSHNDGALSGSSGPVQPDTQAMQAPAPAESARGTAIFFAPLPEGGQTALSAVAHHIDELTVTFVAIINLDAMTAVADDPRVLVSSLNALLTAIDDVVEGANAYKVMVAGGELGMFIRIFANIVLLSPQSPTHPSNTGVYMYVAGGIDRNLQHASTAARAALEIMCLVVRDCKKFGVAGVTPVLQIGLNTGPVAAAVLGTRAVNWSLFGGERLKSGPAKLA